MASRGPPPKVHNWVPKVAFPWFFSHFWGSVGGLRVRQPGCKETHVAAQVFSILPCCCCSRRSFGDNNWIAAHGCFSTRGPWAEKSMLSFDQMVLPLTPKDLQCDIYARRIWVLKKIATWLWKSWTCEVLFRITKNNIGNSERRVRI